MVGAATCIEHRCFFTQRENFNIADPISNAVYIQPFLSESPLFFDITYERGTAAEMKLNITMRILFVTISDIL